MKQTVRPVKVTHRLSRAETTAATRARLLDVAAVVSRAGFTRGAFYAHFTDKADLFVTLLEDSRRADLEQVRGLLARSEGAAAQVAVQEWFDALASQDRWELAYAEFWPQAVRNAALRARLAARQEQVRNAIAQMIESHCQNSGIELPLPVEHVASLMLALGDGVGAQRHLDPHALPVNAFTTATGLLWAGLLAQEN